MDASTRLSPSSKLERKWTNLVYLFQFFKMSWKTIVFDFNELISIFGSLLPVKHSSVTGISFRHFRTSWRGNGSERDTREKRWCGNTQHTHTPRLFLLSMRKGPEADPSRTWGGATRESIWSTQQKRKRESGICSITPFLGLHTVGERNFVHSLNAKNK